MASAESLFSTVALVTGASSGIGEATALALAEAGARVAIVARRRDRLDGLAKRIESAGGSAFVIEADVADDASARDAVERTVRECGRLDTLVNNAGVMLLGPIVGADPAEWKRMLDINVTGLMAMTHAALPHLLEAAGNGPRRVADVVNVSSTAGRLASAGAGGYNATKFAVNAFSEALRQEVTKRHVRIGLIEPGAVATELASHNSPEMQKMIDRRFADMERLEATDIAEAIVFMVTRPRRAAVNEVLFRPTEQER